jgi:sortase A
MERVDTQNNNRQDKKRLLHYIAIAIIIMGFSLALTNLYKFTKGNFAYKTAYSFTHTDEIAQVTIADAGLKEAEDTQTVLAEVTAFTDKKDLNPVLYPVRPEIGEEIGELYIPKLDVTLPIYHGTSEDELDKGVGHYADSVLPGENDNSVLSGHRDTVFRKLGEIGEGDLLIVKTIAGEFTYKVNKVRIVDKDDRTVIVPKPKATLTVSTCYPFVYVGSAPERYILVAFLDNKTLNK